MKAPFPYFGGKSLVASLVWQAIGMNVTHYMEPFFGSGAVLLNRPGWQRDGLWPRSHTETICDADGYVANVWRAMQFDPDGTAKLCDWPINHADLIARKARLVREKNYLLENLCKDEKWFDTELAGYWIWAASCWIGHGLTRPCGIPCLADKGAGVHAVGQIPHLTDKGVGVHAVGQIPHLTDKGKGVHAVGQIPHLINKGVGVHAIGKIPHLDGKGKNVQDEYNTNIYQWFRELSERLRCVRVVCGDWSRICGGNWQDSHWPTVGMFFDPPYGVEDRDNVYGSTDSTTVAHDVRKWCIERGKRPNYRIVIAGYDEHEELAEHGWASRAWKTGGGYANTTRNGADSHGKQNRKRETLWFSPHCIQTTSQSELFDDIT